ncbi:hypothetical protein [Mesorhizobium sp. IMUNJ 23232]|uniref:hypothetical protein n=1 Tax=Mesorhizobium sp. IMUNJ 23232 TaxID=3376064 RepID=UPI0037AA3272
MAEVLVNMARVTEAIPGPKIGTVFKFGATESGEVRQLAVLDAIGDIADMLGTPKKPTRAKQDPRFPPSSYGLRATKLSPL